MNEIDMIFAGLLGGFAGSVIILCTYYFHITKKTKEFFKIKNRMKDSILLINLRNEVADMRSQLKEINTELQEYYIQQREQSKE